MHTYNMCLCTYPCASAAGSPAARPPTKSAKTKERKKKKRRIMIKVPDRCHYCCITLRRTTQPHPYLKKTHTPHKTQCLPGPASPPPSPTPAGTGPWAGATPGWGRGQGPRRAAASSFSPWWGCLRPVLAASFPGLLCVVRVGWGMGY